MGVQHFNYLLDCNEVKFKWPTSTSLLVYEVIINHCFGNTKVKASSYDYLQATLYIEVVELDKPHKGSAGYQKNTAVSVVKPNDHDDFCPYDIRKTLPTVYVGKKSPGKNEPFSVLLVSIHGHREDNTNCPMAPSFLGILSIGTAVARDVTAYYGQGVISYEVFKYCVPSRREIFIIPLWPWEDDDNIACRDVRMLTRVTYNGMMFDLEESDVEVQNKVERLL